jgi:hypothetical protein
MWTDVEGHNVLAVILAAALFIVDVGKELVTFLAVLGKPR